MNLQLITFVTAAVLRKEMFNHHSRMIKSRVLPVSPDFIQAEHEREIFFPK